MSLSAPGYSYILPTLAMGSAPIPGVKLNFDLLVLCAYEYQLKSINFPGVSVLHAPFDDTEAPTKQDLRMAKEAAKIVCKEINDGKRVLVTCWAGRNRSGLVTGLAMRKLGYDGEAVIRLIRARRGTDALSNKTYAAIINK